MSIIKILPENLVNQIAAGEVVERPSSVVKELVENSLDAGASSVAVELMEAGKRLIRVSDNGCGIARDDLEMAMLRHATSKISGESDLWRISSMGFRGEALASVSSVSKLTLRSRVADSESGFQIDCEGGDMKILKEVGMSGGTVVEARELFFNTPARQKYLKKDSTELGHVSAVLDSIALANPGVAFKLVHNDKVVSDLPKVTDLISRVSDIFGVSTAGAMIPVMYEGSEFQINGFVGKPVLARSTGRHQYFFVNRRPITHHLLANTIKQAFHSILMEGKKPVFLINISIDPSLIDVNVHPRKVEIRFEDQQGILRVIYGCVKAALEKVSLIPKGVTEAGRYMSDGVGGDFHAKSIPPNKNGGLETYGHGLPRQGHSVQDAMEFTKTFMAKRDSQALLNDERTLIAISQVSNSYIVAQNEEGLVLIDQHAAHERVRYEELMNQFENEKKSIQPLLVPLEVNFSHDEASTVRDNMNVFEGLGFEMKSCEGNDFIVNGVPSFLSKEDLDIVIKGVLDDILNEKRPSKFQGKTEEIINYMACRSAIKFGQKLDLSEIQSLIDQMEKLQRPYTCPHGRPTMVSLSLGELEKMFGRK